MTFKLNVPMSVFNSRQLSAFNVINMRHAQLDPYQTHIYYQHNESVFTAVQYVLSCFLSTNQLCVTQTV